MVAYSLCGGGVLGKLVHHEPGLSIFSECSLEDPIWVYFKVTPTGRQPVFVAALFRHMHPDPQVKGCICSRAL